MIGFGSRSRGFFIPGDIPGGAWNNIARALLFVSLLLGGACDYKPRFFYDFERETELDELNWQCKTLYRLSGEHVTSGARSLEVEFFPGRPEVRENYPGLVLDGFDPDWSGHRSLVFDVHNPGGDALRLTIRIDDREFPDYPDRYNAVRLLEPGDNHVVIPFAELITSGKKQPLDIARIQGVILFLANPQERHTLYFDHLHLE